MLNAPTIQELEDALNFVDPDMDRDSWVRILMGIKSEFGEEGYETAWSWSERGGTSDFANFKSTWRSINASGATTIDTVFGNARDNGYKPEKKEYSPEEKAALQLKQAERIKKRKEEDAKERAERLRWQAIISDFSRHLISDFTQPVKAHPYLQTKLIAAFSITAFKFSVILKYKEDFTTEAITGGANIKQFFDELPPLEERNYSFLHVKKDDLAIPLMDIDKKVWNLQIINAQGSKMFLKHGRKSGCFHFIGKASNSSTIALAEGYATAASIHMATQWPCAVAFDAGNLPHVATALGKKLPDKHFVICADNDVDTKGNPGVKKANEAAQAVGGIVAIPGFGGG